MKLFYIVGNAYFWLRQDYNKEIVFYKGKCIMLESRTSSLVIGLINSFYSNLLIYL
jgi:hypothetical protein